MYKATGPRSFATGAGAAVPGPFGRQGAVICGLQLAAPTTTNAQAVDTRKIDLIGEPPPSDVDINPPLNRPCPATMLIVAL